VPLRFDLQSHSTYSDGELAPGDVVRAAADAGVQLLALTDHDTVSGVSEALAAGERIGLPVVPAVEISAIDHAPATDSTPADRAPAADRELHILGYGIDHCARQLSARLAEFLADREQRTLRMADSLRELGLELDEGEISARRAAGHPIGRPHVAAAVLGAPANAARLKAEGIADIGDLIRAYLVEGRPAYRLRDVPTVAQAINAIHQAGGVAVWAHPFWDLSDDAAVLDAIERFRALDLDGVEVFYVTHTRAQTGLLAERCRELDLLSTGSADFHGPGNPSFDRFLAFDTHGYEPNLGPISSRR
jgi:predicted metal-dependent phosphoesterase TrpH